nr:MAG TPA: hypothetical protein [Caudoviricetes sp.]
MSKFSFLFFSSFRFQLAGQPEGNSPTIHLK